VVACPELLLAGDPPSPLTELLAPATCPTCWCRPRLRPAAADDFPNLQLPGEVPLLLHLFLIKLHLLFRWIECVGSRQKIHAVMETECVCNRCLENGCANLCCSCLLLIMHRQCLNSYLLRFKADRILLLIMLLLCRQVIWSVIVLASFYFLCGHITT
jgi:hypothetical protein